MDKQSGVSRTTLAARVLRHAAPSMRLAEDSRLHCWAGLVAPNVTRMRIETPRIAVLFRRPRILEAVDCYDRVERHPSAEDRVFRFAQRSVEELQQIHANE